MRAEQLIADLAREAVALTAPDASRGTPGMMRRRARTLGGGGSGVRALLSRLEEAREEARDLERHFARRRDKVLAELRRTTAAASSAAASPAGTPGSATTVDLFERIEASVDRIGRLASSAGGRLVRLDASRNLAREAAASLEQLARFAQSADGVSSDPDAALAALTGAGVPAATLAEAVRSAQRLRAVGERLLASGPGQGGPSAGSPPADAGASPDAAGGVASVAGSSAPGGLTASNVGAVVARVQRHCDAMEASLTASFDRAAQHRHATDMRQLAAALAEFAGGDRLAHHFVRTRPTFLELNPHKLREEAEALGLSVGRPTNGRSHSVNGSISGGGVGKGREGRVDLLGKWYKHCLEGLRREVASIHECFPPAQCDDVTARLASRAFEQNVAEYLAALLDPPPRLADGPSRPHAPSPSDKKTEISAGVSIF